jgi:hypothetical protein
MPLSPILFLIALLQASGAAPAPIPICDVLENLRAYDGKTIVVRAKWTGELVGDCKPPQSPDDPRYPRPGEILVNAIGIASMPIEVANTEPLKTALQQFDKWFWQGYDVYGTFVGRLEVKKPGGFGFGHLGTYSAQIVVTRIEDLERGKKGPRRKKKNSIEK